MGGGGCGSHSGHWPLHDISWPPHWPPQGRKAGAATECGPKLNMMVALPNIGGALCSTPQSLANTHYQSPMQ